MLLGGWGGFGVWKKVFDDGTGFGVLGGELLDGVVQLHAGRMIQANAKSRGNFCGRKVLSCPRNWGQLTYNGG